MTKKLLPNSNLPEKTEPKKEFDIDGWLAKVDLWSGKEVSKLTDQIIKDYNCQTSLELLLAGRVAALSWRLNHWEGLLNMMLNDGDDAYNFSSSADGTQRKAVKELSKGVESTHRQWLTSILLLKELKQPTLNLQIKTKNALIAQNQQINVEKPESKSITDNNLGK